MFEYFKRRLGERSTWAAIGVAVTAGAGLSSPYSWIIMGVGVIGCLVPSAGQTE